MDKFSVMMGSVIGGVLASPPAASSLIDNFDVTVQQSSAFPTPILGGDLVGGFLGNPPGTRVYFDIASVTNPGDPAPPLGGWRGLEIVSGAPATFVGVQRRGDVPGFAPVDFPGILGFQTGPFSSPPAYPPFIVSVIWDGGPTAASGAGLDIDLSPLARIDVELVDPLVLANTVEIKIAIKDTRGNVSSLAHDRFVDSVQSYWLGAFQPDPAVGTGLLADLTDVFSITLEARSFLVGFDASLVSSLEFVPAPVSLASFALGLGFAGWAARRHGARCHR